MSRPPPLYQDLVQQQNLFEELVSFDYDALLITGGEFMERLGGARVSQNFFNLFGTMPLLGSWITPEEQKAGVEDVLVISYATWQSRFGGDPYVVGHTLHRQGTTYTIIGVMPAHFRFPSPLIQYWRPLRFKANEISEPGQRSRRDYCAFARLAPEVSLAQAQAFLDTLGNRLAREFPPECKEFALEARPLRDFFVEPEIEKALWSVALAIGFVLVIACANLAHLQLGRTEVRSREISIRMAVGASRWRLVRQLLTESFLVSLGGGSCGLLVAWWLGHLFRTMLPELALAVRPVGLDWATVEWTFGVAVVCGIAFGLYPACRASGVLLSASLKLSSAATATAAQKWFRYGLVIGEVALAMVLLTGTGLLVRSVAKILHVDPGLNASRLASVSFNVPAEQDHRAVVRDLATRLAATPGITAAGRGPISGAEMVGDYYLTARAEPVELGLNHVGVGECDFFRAIGARLKDGRWLEPSDVPKGQSAVLINETLASLCWPGERAVGKRFYADPARRDDKPSGLFEVAGVVQDFYTWSREWKNLPTFFVPEGRADTAGDTTIYVRTRMDRAAFLNSLRRITKDLLPATTEPRVVWVEQQLYVSTLSRRVFMGFLSAFAGVGLFLSLLGVFGVLTQAVVRRTKEIGVRMALGAQRADVLAQVLGEGMKLTGVGILIGLAGAFGLTRLLRSQLFGIGPTDPVTFVVAPLLLAIVALLACWVPAHRAAKVDPMLALRYE